ncbi:MAG: uroporphyrinogen decarboxylase family protein [Promethearchaeota archaeon]
MNLNLTPEERVEKALNHEEGDRVPHFESKIQIKELVGNRSSFKSDPGLMFFSTSMLKYMTAPWFAPFLKIAWKLLDRPHALVPLVKKGFLSESYLYRKLKMDMMWMSGGIPMVVNERFFRDIKVIRGKKIVTPRGKVAVELSGGSGAAHLGGFLEDPADYDKYIDLDAGHGANYFMVKPILHAAAGKIVPFFFQLGGAFFEILAEMFGYPHLFRLMVKDPGFIRSAVDDLHQYAIASIERLTREGARYFYLADDLGQKQRTIISRRMYTKYFHEKSKKFCQKLHEFGAKVMLHSDGNVMDFLPLFIDAGIDGLHPIEGSSGMDIRRIKNEFGSKITLIGNVPVELLSDGSQEQVETYVRELLETCAPGGGFVLSSSHSITTSCKLDNYRSMLLAGRKFGRYPVKGRREEKKTI